MFGISKSQSVQCTDIAALLRIGLISPLSYFASTMYWYAEVHVVSLSQSKNYKLSWGYLYSWSLFDSINTRFCSFYDFSLNVCVLGILGSACNIENAKK